MVQLSKDPKSWELEDFVAAHFASRGANAEAGVTERSPTDILELDVVWTDYGKNPQAAVGFDDLPAHLAILADRTVPRTGRGVAADSHVPGARRLAVERHLAEQRMRALEGRLAAGGQHP